MKECTSYFDGAASGLKLNISIKGIIKIKPMEKKKNEEKKKKNICRSMKKKKKEKYRKR